MTQKRIRSLWLVILFLLGVPVTAQEMASADWVATTIVSQEAGIWTVKAIDFLAEYAGPELIGLDDSGRCLIAVPYSGRWTILETLEPDGEWLGAVQAGDFDPDRAGRELYVGGKSGRLYQLWPRVRGGFDAIQVADFPAEEIHTLILEDLDPERPGLEFLVFTKSGQVAAIEREGRKGPTFGRRFLEPLPGRVRDYLLLDCGGKDPRFLTVSRTGILAEMRYRNGRLETKELLREPVGFGRLAQARGAEGEGIAVYATRDDGLIMQLREGADGQWQREVIYVGPPGPRGIAAGRFHADPKKESLVVFGYGTTVHLLTKEGEGPWRVEEIYRDLDKGHWLTVTELDGTNTTDEIVISGYSARMTLLQRRPGFGHQGVAVDPGAEPAKSGKPLRVGVAAGKAALKGPNATSYEGGFLPKTLCLETLVQVDERGHLAPGLADSWQVSLDGLEVRLELRGAARFADGSALRAKDVVRSFESWLGKPEHDWLPMNRMVHGLRAEGERTVVFALKAPHALLWQLPAINPCSVQQVSDSTPSHPLETGPYRFLGADAASRTLKLMPRDRSWPALDLVAFDRGPEEALQQFAAGKLDALVSGYGFVFRGEALEAAMAVPGVRATSTRGTSLWRLEISDRDRGSSRKTRLQLRSLLCPKALVREILPGSADAAPAGAERRALTESAAASSGGSPWTLVVDERSALQRDIASHLKRIFAPLIAVEILPLSAAARARAIREGEADLWIDAGYGGPYDPFLSLLAAYQRGPAAAVRTELAPEIEEILATADPERAGERVAALWSRLTEDALILPLFVPRQWVLQRGETEALLPLSDPYRIAVRPARR